VLVLVCPGQGSQTPGFLTPWLELPGVRDRLGWLSAVAGLDLVAHGTVSDAEEIKDTAVAQPLIVGAGLVSLLGLFDQPGDAGGAPGAVGATAGHSVGEITAATVAGALSAEQAMVFVRERGRAMAAASAVTPTGMSAVMGGDPDELAASLEQHGLTAANNNGGGQVVAAGTLEQLAAFAAEPPARARVIPLKVAGAFHTSHMAPAVEVLEGYARAISTRDPAVPLLSNRDGVVVESGREVLDRLVQQVSNPVRWDLCMRTFADLGVTGLIEIPPAGTLTNLAKRNLPGVEVLALKTPDDLEQAHRMIREHGRPGHGDATAAPGDSGTLVTSPSKEA
jgi:[acyl-carrier-protein] S-malonyltransferase